MDKRKFKKWTASFSICALRLITILWAAFLIYSAILLAISMFVLEQPVSVDTLITEVSETFRASVVSILITRTVGNIFEFNNGGIFGESR